MADQLLQCFPGDEESSLAEWLEKVFDLLSKTHSRPVDSKLADLLAHICVFKPSLRLTSSSLLRSVALCAAQGHERCCKALTKSSLLGLTFWPYDAPLTIKRSSLAKLILNDDDDHDCPPRLDHLIHSIAPPIYCIDNIAEMISGFIGDNSLAPLISMTSRLISAWLKTEGDWRIGRLLSAMPRIWARRWPDIPPPFPSSIINLLSSPTTLKQIEAKLDNAGDDVRVTLAAFPEWFSMSIFTFRPLMPSVILSNRSNRAKCQQWLINSFSPDVDISEFIGTGADAAIAVGVLLVPVSEPFAQYDHWPYDRLMTTIEHWIDIAPLLPKLDPITGLERLIYALRLASQSITDEMVVSAEAIRERAVTLWTECSQLPPGDQR